ncbi:MAG: hypothetical protein U1E16_04475 [Hyphomicrobiales bacterium]
MKFAKVTERLNGLGSEKWVVHIEGKHCANQGDPMIFLSIGEPDAPPPAAILDEATCQMHAGRIRYAEGRGERGHRAPLPPASIPGRPAGPSTRTSSSTCRAPRPLPMPP